MLLPSLNARKNTSIICKTLLDDLIRKLQDVQEYKLKRESLWQRVNDAKRAFSHESGFLSKSKGSFSLSELLSKSFELLQNNVYHFRSEFFFFKVLEHLPFKMTHSIFRLAGQLW